MADALQAVRVSLFLFVLAVSVCAPRSKLYGFLVSNGLAAAVAASVHLIAIAALAEPGKMLLQIVWDGGRLATLLPHLGTPYVLVGFLADNDLASYALFLVWNAFALRRGVPMPLRVLVLLLALLSVSGAAFIVIVSLAACRWRIAVVPAASATDA